MIEITSLSNQQIKDAVKLQQKKYRQQTGLFILEGYKVIFEAFNSNVEIRSVYTDEKHYKKFEFIKEKLVVVPEQILKKLSTTESIPEAIAVGVQKKYTLDEMQKLKKIVLLENIKDAGNLGTIIRSAAAFKIDGIITAKDSIDIYNPKVVRSAVGALFKLPILRVEDLTGLKKKFSDHSFIATVVNQKNIQNPTTINYNKPFVLLFGSEADGLSEEAVNLSEIKTTIPISDKTESLNLSVAASIMFYICANY